MFWTRPTYFRPGKYVCGLNKMRVVPTQNGRVFFAADFKVLESNNGDLPVGIIVAYLADLACEEMKETTKLTIANCMRAVLAAKTGEPMDKIDLSEEVDLYEDDDEEPETIPDLLCDPADPLGVKDTVVRVEVFMRERPPEDSRPPLLAFRWSV